MPKTPLSLFLSFFQLRWIFLASHCTLITWNSSWTVLHIHRIYFRSIRATSLKRCLGRVAPHKINLKDDLSHALSVTSMLSLLENWSHLNLSEKLKHLCGRSCFSSWNPQIQDIFYLVKKCIILKLCGIDLSMTNIISGMSSCFTWWVHSSNHGKKTPRTKITIVSIH